MKKVIFVFSTFILLFSFLITAQAFASDVTLVKPSQEAPADLTSAPYPPQPAMFVLKSKTATVYLFGSAHLIAPDTAWRTPQFDYALAKADTIWLESTILEMSNPLLQYTNLASIHNDTKLTDLLSKDEFARLEKVAHTQNLDIMDYNDLHPWIVADILSYGKYQKDAEKDPSKIVKITPGVEYIIEAMSLGKPIKAIENTHDHVLLFSSLPPKDEKALLMNTVTEMEANKDPDQDFGIDKFRDAWSTGDLEALNKFGNTMMEQKTPGLYKAMILERNKIMANRILKQLQGSGTSFMAVGVMHLTGKDSVLKLLEKAGYDAERVYDRTAPIVSTTTREVMDPHYRVIPVIPHSLYVSLRKDPKPDSGKILVHLALAKAINGCVEVSPVQFKSQTEDDGLAIYSGLFFLNLHPWPIRDGCGAANKAIGVDIPVALASLKKDKTKTLRFFFGGGVDMYKLTYDDGRVTLAPQGHNPAYYLPDKKALMVTGL